MQKFRLTDFSNMEYTFNSLEKKWQQWWTDNNVYQVPNETTKPKFYVLDMFPYPSGAGLHVGHPLGYIASDIFSRYKRLKGFNVLHPMGYDAFGLPAEQYAIEHGIHPEVSTNNNIATFRKQLNNIGFCFDWSREVRTCEPAYYKWTQWIFLQLFNSWFNRDTQKAEPIDTLIKKFEKEGSFANGIKPVEQSFSATDWGAYEEKRKMEILMDFRLAYCGYGEVNWCEALGTVLANDEVINGVSERGGHPVEKKRLRQWYLRITEYADRLLDGLNRIEFSEAMKDMQSNWIGKSSGAEVDFSVLLGDGNDESVKQSKGAEISSGTLLETQLSNSLKVYTTRPDTIFGVDFMVLAPEHELVNDITTAAQEAAVDDYIAYVKSRSERERMAEKKISGVFTGSYAVNPFSGKKIPIWISEYVLAGYGTGAIMAVPCGDERDHKFANHFGIPITNIFGDLYNGEEAYVSKEATISNSGFITGMKSKDALEAVIDKLEQMGIGTRKTNYKMRDAAFSRQRYWGEPFPIIWKEGVAYALPESELPVLLPKVDSYKPGPEGEGPLANIESWVHEGRETNTMPGYAGSSWYFLRYMDPHNQGEFCNRKVSDYWNQVDMYIGGTEHAVGHLLYSRMWTKALYDLGHIGFDEPFKKLVNQGMIQGSSRFMYRINGTNVFVSHGLLSSEKEYENKLLDKIHVDVNFVDGFELDIEAFKKWRNGEFAHAEFILEDGKYICGSEVEKMSKSKFNTVNPDDLVARYGADTFRMYEMFLGPIEMSKPWDTKGIEGVHRFLKKLWRLFYNDTISVWTNGQPTEAELKVLHKTIKKIEEDIDRLSLNTCVSTFMIAVNELTDLKCTQVSILQPLLVLLTPFAPHIAEELWHATGGTGSILDAAFPVCEEKYITESTKEYPISINGKLRTTIVLPLDMERQQVETIVLDNEVVKKWIGDSVPKKIIFVPGKMINVVI